MKRKRDTSYKHCSNFILKLMEIQDIKNVNIDVIGIFDDKIELNIMINEKQKNLIINKNLKKEKKILKPESLNNLKNNKNEKILDQVLFDSNKDKNAINNNINEELSSEVISSNETILENNFSQNDVKIENNNIFVDSEKDLNINDNKIKNNLDSNENSGIRQKIILSDSEDEQNNIISQNNHDLESDSDIYEEEDDSVIELPEPCDDCEVTRQTCRDNYEEGLKYMKIANELRLICDSLITKNNEKDNEIKKLKNIIELYNEDYNIIKQIKMKLYKIVEDILDSTKQANEATYRFNKHIDKVLNKGSLRLIYSEKVKFIKIAEQSGKDLDNLQNEIDEELNLLQNILNKRKL
ncbi:hypothetical protein RMATCC62417_18746 [Rhizopus microsporus]|nr:hypothetical protein RMATCC62417_18746 [Rhizopus microsporus]